MDDDEFYQLAKQAEKDLREFKKAFKLKFPHLYRAVKQHEKENNEPDILMVDIFSSKFANEILQDGVVR